ncbi:MAG: DUF4331 family protein [Bacteroidota bacterium]
MEKNQKRKKRVALATAAIVLLIAVSFIVRASDHGDAPAVGGKTTDITDLYAFESPADPNKMVIIANVQGLLSPEASKTASFDPNVLVEFKVDNNNDLVEDLVVQCVFNDGKMYIYGRLKPASTGAAATITGKASVIVGVTPYGSTPIIANSNGVTAFAGIRDDPFFFDVGQYVKIATGQATSFNQSGSDALAGTNVKSIVVEFPKAILKAKGNNDKANAGKVNVWLETKQKS